jgi:hypothetical protein
MIVYVATHWIKTHPETYDLTVRVYRSSAQANAWRIQIANEWWFQLFGHTDKQKPDDPERIAQQYWDEVSGVMWFTIAEHKVIEESRRDTQVS